MSEVCWTSATGGSSFIAVEKAPNSAQSIRSYATEAPAKGGSSTPWIVGAAAIGAGAFGYSFLGTKASADAPAAEKKDAAPAAPKKTFTGGEQGFVDLKLKDVQEYNHNTKKFVFELPEVDAVSGLNVACKKIQEQIDGAV